MSDTMVSLRRKIDGAGDLQSVVRTMKILAASMDEKPIYASDKSHGSAISLRYNLTLKEHEQE